MKMMRPKHGQGRFWRQHDVEENSEHEENSLKVDITS
jgi:hypothetical protein